MPENPSHPQDGAMDRSGASEFTQMFGNAQRPGTAPPTAGPFADPVSTAPPVSDAGFTAIFGTPQPAPAAAASPVPAPDASEAPTQVFAALPHPPRPGSGVSASDETRMFSTAAVTQTAPGAESVFAPRPVAASLPFAAPVPVATPVPAAAPTLPTPPQAASEFTSVFQPIAPPPMVAVPAAASVTAPASGEFTQIFSAVSARASGGAEPLSSAPPRPQTAPPIAPLSLQTVPATPQRAPTPQAVVPPAPPEPQAGEFTMLFGRQAPPQAAAGAVAPIAPPAPPKTEAPPQPGSFTQMFSRPPEGAPAFPPTPAPSQPAAQPLNAADPFASDAIFGAPAPRGSFTDLFAAVPAPQPAAGTASARGNDPFAAQPGPASPLDWSAKPTPAAPVFHAPAPVAPQAPAAAAAGDFTRLMQSLERPSAPAPVPASPLPVDAAFFAHTPASSAGESEYTRVMRGGAAAPAAGLPIATPAAGSSAAPGLALAPAAAALEKSLTDKAGKDKPKTLVILLVVMNVVLLLALIVFAFIFLHRH